ncbi:hypothetical protein BSKO_07684 [Bryopsis sp. KO-2023]|nr:hypothetical protein BSKO_07684 [Bryopsis sp. KO-2023]
MGSNLRVGRLCSWLRLGVRYANKPTQCSLCRRELSGLDVGRWSLSRQDHPWRPATGRALSTDIDPNSYGADHIQVLEGLEPVRKRPGMYIGSTGQRGLHHLLFEVLDNAVDEVQAGFATDVHVILNTSAGTVCIRDNGRGIPTDTHPQTGRSALETVLTVLHAGGKFGGQKSGYKVSGGLHGVGVSVVNALSESLEVTVWRKGFQHVQSFSRGVPLAPMQLSKVDPKKAGTQVEFKYDPDVFSKSASFDTKVIQTRLRELAFLNSNATIHYKVETEGEKSGWEVFKFTGGIKEYVLYLNRDKTTLHDVISCKGEKDGVQVEVGFQWCSDSYSDTLLGFANNIKTIDGGTHIDGLKTALTRTINSLARKNKLLKDSEPNLAGDFVREGLGSIISVKVPDPEFEGQTKTRLGNPEVRKIVDSIVSQELNFAFELHPDALQSVVSKAMQAFRAAEAAKRARELVRRKTVLTKSTLPGKLADCAHTGDMDTEIFIVEGDSAGGSAKQARDRGFQAILPLRGKILNAERSTEEALYKNKEIASLIVALGLGPKGTEKLDSLRYDRVVILTDADVDGAHIRTLLLTFLFRFQRKLFEEGKVFVAVPPLYKLTMGRSQTYCYNEDELKALTKGKSSSSYSIQRFKGLGEMMPRQLWDTTLNPESRTLRRLTVDDVGEASHLITMLMGDKVEPRRDLIQEEGRKFGLLDLDI